MILTVVEAEAKFVIDFKTDIWLFKKAHRRVRFRGSVERGVFISAIKSTASILFN